MLSTSRAMLNRVDRTLLCLILQIAFSFVGNSYMNISSKLDFQDKRNIKMS